MKSHTMSKLMKIPVPARCFHLISTEKYILKYISLRVEVSLFVLSPEMEDRDEVEVGNWAKHKKTFYSDIIYYFIFKRITKKIGNDNFQILSHQ
jgi:hypothetical protein